MYFYRLMPFIYFFAGWFSSFTLSRIIRSNLPCHWSIPSLSDLVAEPFQPKRFTFSLDCTVPFSVWFDKNVRNCNLFSEPNLTSFGPSHFFIGLYLPFRDFFVLSRTAFRLQSYFLIGVYLPFVDWFQTDLESLTSFSGFLFSLPLCL